MALISVAGQTAFDVQSCRPRVGAWHFDMRVDAPDALTGQVQVVVEDGQTFTGTAQRSGEFVETSQVRVVAGNGGLGLSAKPQHYNGTTAGLVLGDLLKAAGETLSPTADAAFLGIALASWTTTALPVGTLIGALIQAAKPGTAWRMLPNGTFWVGAETWPDAGIDSQTYEVMEESAEEASMLVAVDKPILEPGTTFEGRRVSYVQTDVPHVDPVRMRVWFEDAETSDIGRGAEALAALVRATPFDFDYRASYWAKVIAQSGDTIEVEPEQPGVPDMGSVKLTRPAGESMDGIVGGRVLVSWAGGRPDGAYAELFDPDAMPATRTLDVLATLNLGGEGALPLVTEPMVPALAALTAALGVYVTAIAAIADPSFAISPPTSPTGILLSSITAFDAAAAAALTLKARGE